MGSAERGIDGRVHQISSNTHCADHWGRVRAPSNVETNIAAPARLFFIRVAPDYDLPETDRTLCPQSRPYVEATDRPTRGSSAARPLRTFTEGSLVVCAGSAE
jgi:hypothetical protein